MYVVYMVILVVYMVILVIAIIVTKMSTSEN